MSYEEKHRELIKGMAETAFVIHECIVEVAEGPLLMWSCHSPKRSTYWFRIVIGPNLILVTGDIQELVLKPGAATAVECLAWLRKSVNDGGYLLSKASPHIENEFESDMLKEAMERDDVKEQLRSVKGHAKSLLGDVSNKHEFWRVWYEHIGGEAPSVCDTPSQALWQVEALRWFVAHVDAALIKDQPARRGTGIEAIAQKAIEAQDACNVSGLVRSWGEWMPVINRDAEKRKVQQNEHPVNVMMADKISGLVLASTADDDQVVYGRAYKICRDLAAQKNDPEKPGTT